MKKGVLITLGVVALLALMVWADRKFPAVGSRPASTANSAPTGAPTVAMKDVDDHDVTLQQYKGKVVLVNFWATWCEPCQAEIPWMIEFQQKYSPRGFTILGVAMDEEGKKVVAPFLQKHLYDVDGQKESIDYPILLGSDPIAEKFGGIFGLPTTMIYGRDGQKIRTIAGIANRDDLSKAIESAL